MSSRALRLARFPAGAAILLAGNSWPREHSFRYSARDERQATAMKFSSFILLFLVYGLVAVIAFFVARMVRRETRFHAAQLPAASPRR